MRLRALILCSLAAGFVSAPRTATADLAYAIGDGGLSLLRFDTTNPASLSRVGFFNGADTFLDGIDFRPATGELYGYRDATDTYFTVNMSTGMLTSAITPPVGATTNTFNLGIDWNPMIDRLRVVTNSGQNIVYNPNSGTATAATTLFYGAGDVNAGLVPLVIDNAYTNSFAGTSSTQQYVIDHGLNVLATLANNAGTLSTIGEIKVNGTVIDFDEYAGLDIITKNGINTAYALLTENNSTGLYTIDLSSGAATSLGSFGSNFGQIYGLAVVVPEPSSLVLAAAGLVAFGASRAFRRGGASRTSDPSV